MCSKYFYFIEKNKLISECWLSFPIILKKKINKRNLLNKLFKNGVETRPIISGSFVNQPSTKLYNLNPSNKKFFSAQKVQDLGFVIGLHTKKIKYNQLKFIKETLFSIDKI